MTELSEAIRTGLARSGPGGRFVRRGEKGIFILAPMVGNKRKKTDETPEQNTDAKENQRTVWLPRCVCVRQIIS